MDGGGSFWSQFPLEPSSIETLLKNPECTLEELLDDDEVIQECKHANTDLVEFLSKPEAISKLVDYIVTAPPADADDKRRYKFPHVSSEIFACDVDQIADALFSDKELVKTFFSFLERDPPLDAPAATCWCNAARGLFRSSFEKSIGYIKEAHIVNNFVNHVGTYVVMDLLTELWLDLPERPPLDDRWLCNEGVVGRLVEKIGESSGEDDSIPRYAAEALIDMIQGRVHSSAVEHLPPDDPTEGKLDDDGLPQTETMADIKNIGTPRLDRAPSLNTNLLAEVSNELNLDRVLRHMFAEGATTATVHNALNLLSAIVRMTNPAASKKAQKANQELENRLITFAEKEAEKEAEAAKKAVKAEPEYLKVDPHRTLPPAEKLISDKIKNFEALLAVKPNKTIVHQTGELTPPLGATRLAVATLVRTLVNGNYHAVNEAIASTSIIPMLLDLFFEYDLNDFLHGCVADIVDVAIRADSEPLKQALFIKAKLIQRIIDGAKANEEARTKPKSCRKGYMAHAIMIANMVKEHAGDSVICDALAGEARWAEFSEKHLAPDKNTQTLTLEAVPAKGAGALSSLFADMANDPSSADLLAGMSGDDVMKAVTAEFAKRGMEIDMDSSSDSSSSDEATPVDNPFGDEPFEPDFGAGDPFADMASARMDEHADPFAELAQGTPAEDDKQAKKEDANDGFEQDPFADSDPFPDTNNDANEFDFDSAS